jgi:hypothetical protein
MVTEQQTSGAASNVVRSIVGLVLFVGWLFLTVLWVYSIIVALGDGQAGPLIKGVCALLLMALLAGMEGLEVAVIDRWSSLYPDRPSSELAGWLAARQMFVALIVTAAGFLVEPDVIYVPFSSLVIETGNPLLTWFAIVWNTITVLWFAQIVPKHMAATDADRYLKLTKPVLFPIVQVVHHLGVSKPAETVATFVERRLDWEATEGAEPGPELEGLPVPRGQTLASAWAALIPDGAPSHRRRAPDDRAGA